jgi:hypothetical protein
MEYNETTYRTIAKTLSSHSGAQEDEYTYLVEETLQTILALPQKIKYALKSAYVFSRKAPKEEREDLFQTLMLNLIKADVESEKLAYSIARCDWKDFWKSYKIREHYSLDATIASNDDSESSTLGDILESEIRFEYLVDSKLDAEKLWNMLPFDVKPIIGKRLQNKALTSNERVKLHRYMKAGGASLVAQSA